MRARLFETLTISRAAGGGARSRLALPLSLTAHAAGVVALISIPLWTAAELPAPLHAPTNEPVLMPTVVRIVPQPTPAPATLPAVRRNASGSTQPPGPSRAIPRDVPDGPPAPDIGSDLDPALPLVDGPGCPECTGPIGGDPTSIALGAPVGDPGPRLVVAERDVQAPRKLRSVAPVYPELALRAHVQGKVIVECTIDTSGRIAGARVLSGHPLLDAAALTAVGQWVYKPTLLDGVPVAVLMTVTVNFTLSR